MLRVDRVITAGQRTWAIGLSAALLGLAPPGARRDQGLRPRAEGPQQQMSAAADSLHQPLDEILDIYVRDGRVYYLALRRERQKLDRYVASLDVAAATYDGWSRDRQMAFWVNAYNAVVLRTVIDRYPIRGTSPRFPASSIQQIPGAFDRLRHRVAGRAVTLDEIEYKILQQFHDPRAYFALGRGALGSPRLRSEAYTAVRLEAQLAEAAREFASMGRLVRIDRVDNHVSVSPVIGWHEAEFITAYMEGDGGKYPGRSPIERAVLTFIGPSLLPTEIEFVQKNQFQFGYLEFDWRLNDLTGQ